MTGAGNVKQSRVPAVFADQHAAVPMVQYQDLGLTLNVTPKVLRNDDVALTID